MIVSQRYQRKMIAFELAKLYMCTTIESRVESLLVKLIQASSDGG